MSAEQASPAFADFDQSVPIDYSEAMALQSFVRGPIVRDLFDKNRKIHTREEENLVQSFCVFQSGSLSCREGSEDWYLAIRMLEFGASGGGVHISIMGNEFTSSPQLDAERKVHQVRWDENHALARTVIFSSIRGEGKTARWFDGRWIYDSSRSVFGSNIVPLETKELASIGQRAHEIVNAVRALRKTYYTVFDRVDYFRELEEYRSAQRDAAA